MKTKITLMLILFSILTNAQNNYESNWQNVKNHEKQGKPKSALTEVETIYNLAKADKNAAQIIKSILYKSKYALTLEEDAQLNIISSIKQEIVNSNSPEKNILESILANLYWQYFQQNRHKFYNRTNTSEKVNEIDFRTWDLHTIFNEIHNHHQNALQNAITLQNTNLKKFNEILNTQENSQKYRPTVYDFIAHNALSFYKTGESNLAQPSYKFEIEDENFLGNNQQFLDANFISKDTTSQKLNALKIYKNLSLFHRNDKDKTALVAVILSRLDFVKQNATFTNKEEIYFETLKSLQSKYRKHEISTEIDYRIALYYQQLANKFVPNQKTEHQFKLRNTIEVCEIAKTNFPNSKGAKKCQNLKNTILQPYVQLTNEKNIEKNTKTRLLVSYKNLNHLYFNVYKVTNNEFEQKLNRIYNHKDKLKAIKKLTIETTFSSVLKTENDFQNHTTEVVFPKLNQGNYIIVASKNADFNDDNLYAYSFIQATNIVLIETNHQQKYQYQVVNRFTGKPLKDAKIHLKNINISKYNKVIDKTLTTNKDGFVQIVTSKRHNQIVITATHNDDKGVFKYFYLHQRNRHTAQEYKNNRIFLFTDRSIYRPSQTVYFKGIAVEQQENKSNIVANRSVKITLKDANHQNVKSLNLVTNEFGSFSGEFILPNSGLTGIFNIYVEDQNGKNQFHGNVNISVEEYKRPKFSAKFHPVKESVKLNENVTVKGIATAYAGSDITDAKVVYKVTRKVQYPKWWYWYRPFGFNSEAQEITHGETKTNEKGEFDITFLAQPDKSVNKKDLPIFTYEISADIIDINGETRSAKTTVMVGYHAITINMGIDTSLDKLKKDNKISLTTNNLNGQFVATKGTLKIYKLKSPKSVYRNRPWSSPDYQEIPKEVFEKEFPHEFYSSIKQEEKGELVLEKSFDTGKSKEINISKSRFRNKFGMTMKDWKSGKYIAIATTKDKFNNKVSDKIKFEIYSNKDKKVADNQLFNLKFDKDNYQPNDVAILKIGSASKDISVVIFAEKNNKQFLKKIIHLNNEIKSIEIPITEEHRGGFGISYYFVNFNSYQANFLTINVPFEKTDLEIETLTFRDKLQPNKEETWSFKLKGPKGDKVTAEILTSMYDASLDQFKNHQWSFSPIYFKNYYGGPYSSSSIVNAGNSFGIARFNVQQLRENTISIKHQSYDALNWFGLHFGYRNYFGRVESMVMESVDSDAIMIRGNNSIKSKLSGEVAGIMIQSDALEDKSIEKLNIGESDNEDKSVTKINFDNIKARTNFKETAFFFPHLKTDKDGNVSFSFTTPESLTKWKLQLLAHTKDLNHAVKSLETVTQKELMVLPNPPRFLRQGDEIVFSSKIANISDKTLNGEAKLTLLDAITGKDITNVLMKTDANSFPLGKMSQSDRMGFSVDAKGNTNLSWKLTIPDNIQTVQYKIVAKAGDFSDGEQNVLPVLTNRMLVTETMPMWLKSNQTKTFTLDKLKNTTSASRKNHKLTLEVTSNPVWYAVQALPYLMEYPYECAEQTFARYYANTLASHIANSNPRIQNVFNQWKNTDALLSNLEKNQELKSLIIQETPWLRDAQSETEQKKRIALLFDLNKMKDEQHRALKKLKQMQMASGGFPWFKGSRYANRFITQHIVSGLGHLDKLNALGIEDGRQETEDMLRKAISYLDNQILKDYQDLLERARKQFANSTNKEQEIKDYLKQNHTSHFQIQYLYARSFYKNNKIPKKVKVAVDFYTNQSYKYWLDYNLYAKGLIALIANRNDNNAIAENILVSLKENSITSEELGMYWKSNTSSYYWFQAPIETQALMIEVFSEVGSNNVIPTKPESATRNLNDIDNLKIWLLKNKQTNRWKTTKATSEAVYALLLQGTDWLESTNFVEITIGNKIIKPLELENSKVEAGTGYFKTSWNGNEITPEMATVKIKKQDKGVAWGAMYWQYFEDLDKITFAETPLRLKKKLFLKTNENRGEKLTEITDKTKLQLGDLVRVRIELSVDRNMEFIHMKDMRASGFEPVNVLSQYKWQDGLGYYESTKDASTNFFIDFLPKGVYVFEYDLRVNNKGDFSNGITTIQSMYAPEFSSHSEGVRVVIE